MYLSHSTKKTTLTDLKVKWNGPRNVNVPSRGKQYDAYKVKSEKHLRYDIIAEDVQRPSVTRAQADNRKKRKQSRKKEATLKEREVVDASSDSDFSNSCCYNPDRLRNSPRPMHTRSSQQDDDKEEEQ